jgi:WD40 repeat protein
MAVDCHPQRDHLVAGGADGVPKLYRMHREKKRRIGDDYNLIQTFERVPGRIFDLEFDREGKHVVVGSSFNLAGEVRLYAVDEGEQFVAQSKEQDETVARANPEKTEATALWKLPVPSAIYAVAFNPQRGQIAAAGFSGKVLLIDQENGSLHNEFAPVPLEPVRRSRRF